MAEKNTQRKQKIKELYKEILKENNIVENIGIYDHILLEALDNYLDTLSRYTTIKTFMQMKLDEQLSSNN